MARECAIRGACTSTHFRVKLVLLSISNIAIHHQNYHDITNFTNLTTFTLYKILEACIISANTQIMKWHNKEPGSKNFPPWAMAHVGPCVNTVLATALGRGRVASPTLGRLRHPGYLLCQDIYCDILQLSEMHEFNP